MRNRYFFPLVFVIIIFTCTTAKTQNHGFQGPNKDDAFFILGWSKDYSKLAYGWYNVTSAISTTGRIVLRVKDLIYDRVDYQYIDTWDEGNAGDGMEVWYPKTNKEAWNAVKKNVHAKLDEHKIEWDPIWTNIYLTDSISNIKAEIRENTDQSGKLVYLVSEKYGEREIYRPESYWHNELSIYGFVEEPELQQAALIIGITLSDFPFFEYRVKGFCITKDFLCQP